MCEIDIFLIYLQKINIENTKKKLHFLLSHDKWVIQFAFRRFGGTKN